MAPLDKMDTLGTSRCSKKKIPRYGNPEAGHPVAGVLARRRRTHGTNVIFLHEWGDPMRYSPPTKGWSDSVGRKKWQSVYMFIICLPQ